MKTAIRLIIFLAVVWWAAWASAAEMTLTWNPVEGADGYKVYYGSKHGEYQDPVNSGSQTSMTMPYDTANMKYLAVTAYNKWGESDYSEEAVLLDAPKWKTILKVK